MLSKYLLPPDVYFRHCLAADQIKGLDRILDVGGSLGELKFFLPKTEVVTADVVIGADVVYDGANLPFSENEFETVVSVDTMEHIPQSKRIEWLDELIRVAKKKVVVIAPFKSMGHDCYEDELMNKYINQKHKIPDYLLEHRRYGLPDMDLVNRVKSMHRCTEIYFVGNVKNDKINFGVHMFEVKNKLVNKLLFYLKFVWNATNNMFCQFNLSIKDNQFSSRILIIIEK